MKYLFATTNKAKIKRYGTMLKEKGIEILTLEDFNLEVDVDESGNNPIENAIIKATEYNKISNMITIAMDDGLFLDNVPNEIQPGTHVRRVNGKRLNDNEMIKHYISLVNRYGEDGKLNGFFIKGVAIVNGDNIYKFAYKTPRTFSNKQSKIINEGYPLASIQIVQPFGKFKTELNDEEEKIVMNEEKNSIVGFIIETINVIEGSCRKYEPIQIGK